VAAKKSNSSCSKCGKPFFGLKIIKAFAAIYAIYLFATFFFNLMVSGDDWMRDKLSFLEPIMPFGLEYIAISFVLLIIGLPILMAGILPAMEKKYKSAGVLACKECQGVIAREQAEAAEMARAKQEAQAYAYQAKIDGLENGDPWIGKLIRSWKQDNPNKLPEESMIDELVMARNMEKAGNFEKAAVILEKYRFWEEAGRMRRLDDQKVIKHITVDMNELIDQVGTKGLAIPYKCSSCGASITIDKDSKKEGLKFCSYCGTAYNVDDMTKIIQHALE
jgi:DNA-directed RNA polymerase subunit RPC12/RpoP